MHNFFCLLGFYPKSRHREKKKSKKELEKNNNDNIFHRLHSTSKLQATLVSLVIASSKKSRNLIEYFLR